MDTGVAKQGIQSTMSIEKCESNEIEVLIEEYANMVFQLALAKTKNTQLAEDIFQDVFLKIIGKKRGKYICYWKMVRKLMLAAKSAADMKGVQGNLIWT